MASSNKHISARGKGILSRALEKLDAKPPTVQPLPTHEMCDAVVYLKTVSNTVIEQMRRRGYKVKAPSYWDVEYDMLMALVDRLGCTNVEQSAFNASIKRAKEYIDKVQIVASDDTEKSDEEWEDVDTSIASIKSTKGAARKSILLSAKKSLKQMMQDSAKKSAGQLSRFDPNKSTRTLKKNTSATDAQTAKDERQPRALKRQASTVVASDAKKDKKTSGLEMDKTEFARSQNSRVQLVKERKELKDKERNELIKAKLQQKQMSLKDKEKKAAKESKVSQKKSAATVSAVSKSSKAQAAPAAVPVAQNTNGKSASSNKQSAGNFVKPTLPAPVANALVPPRPVRGKNESPGVSSMQNKARDGLRQGDLAKQAMYHSILAAGDETRTTANSTFLPGVEVKPDFDASLALKATIADTFVVDAMPNATFVSKPGLGLSPSKKPLESKAACSASFVDSFNESYRDYGLEDLCSDSDNTDDESAPTKPVPKWADMKTSRFKDRVKKQRALGQDILKYGMRDIHMPPCVDLEMIFEEKNKRFDRHNASSGMWNDTQDFIRH